MAREHLWHRALRWRHDGLVFRVYLSLLKDYRSAGVIAEAAKSDRGRLTPPPPTQIPPDVEAASELGMRPLVAHCHLGVGKFYRRTGKPEQQAQEHFTIATTVYREMAMRFWLEKAAEEGIEPS